MMASSTLLNAIEFGINMSWNYYLVEFFWETNTASYEEVSAISAQEAVNSIKKGWPKCEIQNVWVSVGENDPWKDGNE